MTKPKHDSIATLQSLAKSHSDAALAALGEALAASRTSAERLQLLQRYRDEYQGRLTVAVRNGVTTLQLANYRAFLDKLDAAIAQAAAEAQNRTAVVAADTARWHEARQREKSFEVIADRRAEHRRSHLARQDQKLADEIATGVSARHAERS